MQLTLVQKQTLKASILASELAAQPNNDVGNQVIADAYNLAASPAYRAWRTSVSRAEIYNRTSLDGTTWDWTIYKGQSVTEQGAWVQMFMGDQADFSQANLRGGVAKIFGAANAQTAHVLAIGQRLMTRVEKLFAAATVGGSGTRGSSANPDTFVIEGLLTFVNVEEARNS
jgi:hypothetical protein